MKKPLTISALVIVFVTLTLIFYQTVLRGQERSSYPEKRISFEDAIIINEIKMQSEYPPEDSPSERKSSSRQERVIVEDESTNSDERDLDAPFSLAELRKEDPRWHMSNYTIRKNDSIWKIASRFGVSHRLIIQANDLTDPDTVRPGRTLKIPNRNGSYYTIQRGDTVIGIARKFNVDPDVIIEHNNLNPRRLYVGKKIFIPDGERVKPDKSSSRPVPVQKKRSTSETKVSEKRAAPQKKEARVAKQTGALPAFRWPLRGKITSGFGNRKDPFSGKRAFHCGIDISVNEGTPIRASSAGRVIFSGWKEGYGRVVILRHEGGYITVYAHNSKNKVNVNDRVDTGEIIALSGKTGAVTGAHLHFELRKYVTPLNPMRFLK
jgi:murein DD-endopeptidase MepM/ murein hydrolase activator NlpD